MPQGSLGQVLQRLGTLDHPSLLAGSAGFEDAGVYKLDDERALVVTVDFFPPIVDDPRWFGRIAAANALSDVYAMGGVALTALNLVGWPKDLDIEILGEILAGGLEKVKEAGAALAGGHSVQDSEIKYGMAVTGLVHPERFWANSGARVGDLLVLTKPLGMGAVSTAIKKRKATPEMEQGAMVQMATLNKKAAEAVADLGVHGCTDITGFGLLGHGCEMADGSKLTLHLRASHVPIFPGALDLARHGILSGGCKRGRTALADKVRVNGGLEDALADLLFDAETSGGLLLSLSEDHVEKACKRLADAGAPAHAVVGRFTEREDGGPCVMVE